VIGRAVQLDPRRGPILLVDVFEGAYLQGAQAFQGSNGKESFVASMIEGRECDSEIMPTRGQEWRERGEVDIRLYGKGNSKIPWRKAGRPRPLVVVVDSDQ
jgi:hypothetical protein